MGIESVRHVGRVKSCQRSTTPDAMSPPTKFSLCRSMSAGVHHGSCEDAVAKAWSEALDLPFDPRQHVDRRGRRHVTIGPRHMSAGWRTRRVDNCRLRQQHKWPVRYASVPRVAFRYGDFLQRCTKMNGSRSTTRLRSPWNGSIECPIHLERSQTGTGSAPTFAGSSPEIDDRQLAATVWATGHTKSPVPTTIGRSSQSAYRSQPRRPTTSDSRRALRLFVALLLRESPTRKYAPRR